MYSFLKAFLVLMSIPVLCYKIKQQWRGHQVRSHA